MTPNCKCHTTLMCVTLNDILHLEVNLIMERKEDEKDLFEEESGNFQLAPFRDSIYQANPLINVRKGMDTLQLRLFALALQAVDPWNETEFKQIKIKPAALAAALGNDKYLNVVPTIAKKMLSHTVKLPPQNPKNPKDKGGESVIFQSFRYIGDEGLIMKFGDDMKPYLLQLLDKEYGYTRITMKQIFPLSSSYAWRLVELLIQYRGFARKNGTGIIERKFSVEELRNVLDVPEGAYDRIAHFRSRVLDGPIREINRKTNYVMSYESIKEGRRIVAFLIKMDISAVPEDMTDDTRTYDASEKDYTYVKHSVSKRKTEETQVYRPEPVYHAPSDGSLKRALEEQGYHSPHMDNLFKEKNKEA